MSHYAALICLLFVSAVHVSGQTSSAIRLRMQSLVDKGTIPGAVTLVIKKDRVVSFEAVGYRDLETKAPMTPDTIFDIRSMTKPGGIYKGRRILARLSVQQMTMNQTLGITSAVTGRLVVQGLSFGLAGDPLQDFPLTTLGSFGHNGAFGTIFWIDPAEGMIRIFMEQVFGSGNESDLFMSMAVVAAGR